MTSLAPSPVMVSLIQTAGNLPYFLLGLLAGTLADIADRRRLLIVSQLWMLASAGSLGILTLLHLTTPWILLAMSFSLGSVPRSLDPQRRRSCLSSSSAMKSSTRSP
jgi:MFS family permease